MCFVNGLFSQTSEVFLENPTHNPNNITMLLSENFWKALDPQ
jgi:hypothetical protein